MPKPLKKSAKPAKKSTTPKRLKGPSADPILRSSELRAEHLAKVETAQPPWKVRSEAELKAQPRTTDVEAKAITKAVADIRAIISVHMAKLGAKGGKISGAKRMEMPERQRKAIAKAASAARWGKKR